MQMKQMAPVLLVVLILTVGGIFYAVQGFAMHGQAAQEEQKFNDLQASYWLNSKEVRDAAPTGSELNQDLVRLSQYPSQLLFLKLVGIGRILTGIFAVLVVIGILLFMMPVRLKQLTERGR